MYIFYTWSFKIELKYTLIHSVNLIAIFKVNTEVMTLFTDEYMKAVNVPSSKKNISLK